MDMVIEIVSQYRFATKENNKGFVAVGVDVRG